MAPIPNRGPELFRVDVAFAVIATIAVLLRCYVRLFMVKAFGIDDWLMSFSMVRALQVYDDLFLQRSSRHVVVIHLLRYVLNCGCALWHWSPQLGSYDGELPDRQEGIHTPVLFRAVQCD